MISGPLVSPFKVGISTLNYGLLCAAMATWIASHQVVVVLKRARKIRPHQSVKRLRDQLYGSIYLQHSVWFIAALFNGAVAVGLYLVVWLVRWLRPHASPESNWIALAVLLILAQTGLSLAVFGFVRTVGSIGVRMARKYDRPAPPPVETKFFHWSYPIRVLAWTFLLLTQGLIVTCLFSMMLAAFRQCLTARHNRWNWARYVSLLAGAFFSLVLVIPLSPLRPTFDIVRHAIGVAGLLTCAFQLLDLSPPVLHLAELWRLPPKDLRETRQGHIAWLAASIVGALISICGIMIWPDDTGMYLLAAVVAASTLRSTDGTSFAFTVFCLVSRWTLWMVAARQSGWQVAAIFLACELVLLLPTLEASWRVWQRRDLPENPREARRRSLRTVRTAVGLWKSWRQISVVLARSASYGVVLRRGPNDEARLILWRTDTDEFVKGLAFNGYVSPRLCDLSADGRGFVYFTRTHGFARNTQFLPGWTALCAPPDPTPVAIWKKPDDSNGGGVFLEDDALLLGHSLAELDTAQQASIQIRTNDSGQVEIEHRRQHGWVQRPPHEGPANPLSLWQKQDRTGTYLLREYFRSGGLGETGLELCTATGSSPPQPLDVEWADWDQQNRLVAVRHTSLCAGQIGVAGEVTWREIADFSKI